MKTIAIIPVRGGSKSIPLKNIKKINNRPLVYWTIDAAINCKYIDEVYISTDSEEIINVVEQYDRNNLGKLRIFSRSKESATDIASTESAMIEVNRKVQSDITVLIQATSPLTEAKHLEEAFELYFKEQQDSLLSVVNQKRFIWNRIDGNKAKPVNYNPLSRPRRQDFEGYYVENGAFYITKTGLFMNTECRISEECSIYEMPEETYFEIDEPSDWLIVEALLQKRESKLVKSYPIKLFAMDCDGVLTDAGMYYSPTGEVMKKFNTKDGMGIARLKQHGIIPAILTGENSEIVKRRAEKLGIEDVFLGCINKVETMQILLSKYNISFDEVAYIGDDINDLALLKQVGISFSVVDALPNVLSEVNYVTNRRGGDGAVREAIEIILALKE